MFTYKFLGLREEDSSTPYYYGSLPRKPIPGHILLFEKTGNRYKVVKIAGQGLESDDGPADQERLAVAEIIRGDTVATLRLKFVGKHKKPGIKELSVAGGAVTAEEIKERSRKNRKLRLAKTPPKKNG